MVGLTTSEDIKITFYNKENELVDGNDRESVTIHCMISKLNPIFYLRIIQPLAKDKAGGSVYQSANDIDWSDIDTLSDFEHTVP